MIKKLEINNYQSHKRTEIDFHPGVNIILGTSDSGKTAILRALRWAVSNKPGGDAFRSSWGGETSVVATFDDCEITRTKGKENTYHLGDKVFKAFGQDVPKEILDAINLTDTNVQGQLDAPYLLSQSSGEVAAHFNRMANLTVIDTSLQFVQKEMNAIKSNVDLSEKAIKKIEVDLSELVDIAALEEVTKQLLTIEENYLNTEKDIDSITASKRQLITLALNKDNYKNVIEAEKDVIAALASIEVINNLRKDRKQLFISITEIQELKEDKNQYKHTLSGEEDILRALQKGEEIGKIETTSTALSKIVNSLEKNNRQQGKYQRRIGAAPEVNACLDKIKTYDQAHTSYLLFAEDVLKITHMRKKYEVLQQRLNNLQKEYIKIFPEVCPLCNNPQVKL